MAGSVDCGEYCVVVLAAVGTGGYLYWNHDRLTAASEECATSYDRAVKARKKLTEYLESDAVKTAIRVKDSEVKDAKTVGTLASTVKAVEKTKTDIPECPADGLKDIKAVTARLDKTATAYEKTVNEVRGKANAVNASKTDKTVADATKVLDDSKGRVKDDKVRTALENAIKSKDGKAISDAMKRSTTPSSEVGCGRECQGRKGEAGGGEHGPGAGQRLLHGRNNRRIHRIHRWWLHAIPGRRLHVHSTAVHRWFDRRRLYADATAAATAAFPGRWQRRRFHGRGRRI